MSRRRRSTLVTLAVVAAGALVASVVAVVLARDWAGRGGGAFAPQRTTVTTRVDPPSVLFGDAIEAVARILVDPREVDPASVTLDPSFKPFQTFASERVVTDGIGRASEVVFTFRLQCVTGTCIGAMEQRQRGGSTRTVPITLPTAVAHARAASGGGEVRIAVTWPSVVVHSRLTAEDVALGEPSAPASFAAPVDRRISAGVLGWTLLVVAVLLVCAAAALVASVLVGRRAERTLRLPANMGPVDRALALARYALANDDLDGGRKALERLASELEHGGRAELAGQVARIAWSPPGPSPSALDDVARQLDGQGSRG
jgi:hypothetical protein